MNRTLNNLLLFVTIGLLILSYVLMATSPVEVPRPGIAAAWLLGTVTGALGALWALLQRGTDDFLGRFGQRLWTLL